MTNSEFSPYPWTLREVVERNFYVVPIYQRPYTWSDSEVGSLLDDLFVAYRERDIKTNDSLFTGTLFLRNLGKGRDGITDKYEIVDGQQRLTTFSMILMSIYSIARKRGFTDSEKDLSDLRSFLWKYSRNQREYHKYEPLITLSSIDKDFSSFMFDQAYENPEDLLNLVDGYTAKCHIEVNLRDMLHKIYERIEKEIPFNDTSKDEILRFLAFLQDRILFIAIQANVSMPRVFSVFESINSKGKPLDTIDLIKTYIFSVLEEKDYNTYLAKWGELIIKTNDHLEDYLQVFVKAFLFFYRQKINLKEFRWMSRQLPGKFGVTNEAEGLKKLIDLMIQDVEAYELLSNEADAERLIDKPSFTTYYKLFLINGYSHPRPIIFRAFCDHKAGLISKEDVVKVVKSATLFMFKFQSIKGGDSKDAIKYFEDASKKTFANKKINASDIEKTFKNALVTEGIDKNTIVSSFKTLDFYSKHDLAYCVLALLESVNTTDGKNKLLFSQASSMLSHIKDKTFQIDHMLPQNPDKNNPDLKYYCDNSSGDKVLVLKEGHDFPSDSVSNGMNYAEFESKTLHRIGNIRLYLPELNGSKGNATTHIPGHEDFTTYKQIIDRSEKLADLLFSCSDL